MRTSKSIYDLPIMSDRCSDLFQELVFGDTVFHLDNEPSGSWSIEPLNLMKRRDRSKSR